MADHCRRLDMDREFLSCEGVLSERLMDRIVLHLFRIYPQILNNSEAEAFRSLNAPVHIRISDLLQHLQSQSNKACKEFYNALELNDPQIYNQLPSKHQGETTSSVATNMDIYHRERYILNNRGPVFFLACFSVAAGLAIVLYYCKEETKFESVAKKIVGFSSLGFGRRARRFFLAYLEARS